MSTSLQIVGKLHQLSDAVQVTGSFKKREFVIELADEVNGNVFLNYAKMQVTQTRCDVMDRFEVGSTLEIDFNVRGRAYEKDGKTGFFTNLEAWRINKTADAPQQNRDVVGASGERSETINAGNGQPDPRFNGSGNYNPAPGGADDLPF